MVIKQQLAGLLWAAILVLAAQALPGVAWSHAGHPHASPAAVDVAGKPSVAEHQTGIADAVDSFARHHIAVTDPAMDSGSAPSGTASGGCTGWCCGNGTLCCGVALPTSLAALPALCGTRPPAAAAASARPGADPEALPEPPKSLA